MEKVNLVSVNQSSHNRDYVKNPQRYILKCYSWRYFGGTLFDFYLAPEERTRCQILNDLKEYFSFGSRVSIDKSFFSSFNSNPIFKKYSADLSYFYDKLPLSKDYLPVAIERIDDDMIEYIIAIPVKDESKL